jgi:signal transduction histidine kinase
VLIAVNVVILLLPLAGIRVLRLYENELARQTEAALIAEGAYVREHFRSELVRAAPNEIAFWQSYGRALPQRLIGPDPAAGPFDPILPDLDLAREPVLSPAADPLEPGWPADPLAVVAAEPISALLRDSQRHTLAGVRVVDFRGVVVASSRGEHGLSLARREEVLGALSGERVRLVRQRISDEPPPPLAGISRGNRVRLFVALPVAHRGRVVGAVVLSRTPPELQKALHQNRATLIAWGGGLVAVVLVVSVLTATTISRPIASLVRQAREVQRGELAQPIAHPGSLELEQLSQALAETSRNLGERAAYIESFARSVSHEYKTPLSTLGGSVELLRDHLDSMTREERDRFLGILERETRRMQRLVERLLELARADTFRPGDADCEVAPVLARIVERFRAEGLDVRLAAEPDQAGARVRADAEVLELVVGNLIENARQHAGAAARVEVSLLPGSRPDRLRIRVQDDGPGISAANRARALEAFFTTARERGGTGLGLTITRSLVAAHGGRLELEPATDRPGLSVAIELPRQ